MGFKFRKQIGPKGFKLNIGKRGITSASFKIAKGITYNTKRGLTLGIPGTGMSYNFGKKKTRRETSARTREISNVQPQEPSIFSNEYTIGWRKFTGGYNKKSMIAVGICLVLCITPLWPLGLVALMPALIWFLIDTSIKIFRYSRHLKNIGASGTPETPYVSTSSFNLSPSTTKAEATETKDTELVHDVFPEVDDKGMKQLRLLNNIKLSGVTKKHEGINPQETIESLSIGEEVFFKRIPMEKYPNATLVVDHYDNPIGWIPEDFSYQEDIAKRLDDGTTVKGLVNDIFGGGTGKNYGIAIDIVRYQKKRVNKVK